MAKDEIQTMEELKKRVISNRGIVSVQMDELKRIFNAGKLGVNILGTISKTLRDEGLGHIPYNLPKYQHEWIRVYLIGSEVGNIITAANKVGEEYDSILRKAVERDDADVLQKIRELIK